MCERGAGFKLVQSGLPLTSSGLHSGGSVGQAAFVLSEHTLMDSLSQRVTAETDIQVKDGSAGNEKPTALLAVLGKS